MPLQNVQPQQDKINKDMRQGSSAVQGPRTGVLLPPPPASLPVQLIIQVKIFISCDPYKISQVVVTVSVSVSSPLPSFVPWLALSFHSVRQLLTLPQMTAPKMAGCPFRLVGMGQVREASSTRHRRRLVCCGKFMVANCFAPDRGKQRAGQKRLARGG